MLLVWQRSTIQKPGLGVFTTLEKETATAQPYIWSDFKKLTVPVSCLHLLVPSMKKNPLHLTFTESLHAALSLPGTGTV